MFGVYTHVENGRCAKAFPRRVGEYPRTKPAGYAVAWRGRPLMEARAGA
jgi:hypothetical protein